MKCLLLAERAARVMVDRGPMPNRTLTGAAALLATTEDDAHNGAATPHARQRSAVRKSSTSGMRASSGGGGREEEEQNVTLLVCELRDQVHWLRRQQLEQQQRASRREEELLAALAEARNRDAQANNANSKSAGQSSPSPDEAVTKLRTLAGSSNDNNGGSAGMQPQSANAEMNSAVKKPVKSSLKAQSKYGQLESALQFES